MRHQAFAVLSLHAKMHRQLDELDARKRGMVERIEKAEIRAYDNDVEFRRLESLKKELLAITFIEHQAS